MDTLFTGKPIKWFETLDSTNRFATNEAHKGFAYEGIVYATYHQVEGKGQRDNKWESAPFQNLTFSVVYEPDFLAATEQFYLNMAVCIALTDFLNKELSVPAKVKWPNDIYVGYDKIAGVLIENTLRGQGLGFSVIGIGLNVNQEFYGDEVRNPTSIKAHTGKEHALEPLLERFLSYLEAEYLLLKARRFNDLYDRYTANLLFFNEERHFIADNEVFSGTITGIKPDGKLNINTRAGNRQFAFKEVEFVV